MPVAPSTQVNKRDSNTYSNTHTLSHLYYLAAGSPDILLAWPEGVWASVEACGMQ